MSDAVSANGVFISSVDKQLVYSYKGSALLLQPVNHPERRFDGFRKYVMH